MTSEEFDRGYLWHYRAQVLRVIDGDTAVLLIDTGFLGRHEVHIRLFGVYAPEMHTPEGPGAKGALETVLARAQGAWPLRVRTIQRERSVTEVTSFERYVAELWIAVDGELQSVADLLVN